MIPVTNIHTGEEAVLVEQGNKMIVERGGEREELTQEEFCEEYEIF